MHEAEINIIVESFKPTASSHFKPSKSSAQVQVVDTPSSRTMPSNDIKCKSSISFGHFFWYQVFISSQNVHSSQASISFGPLSLLVCKLSYPTRQNQAGIFFQVSPCQTFQVSVFKPAPSSLSSRCFKSSKSFAWIFHSSSFSLWRRINSRWWEDICRWRRSTVPAWRVNQRRRIDQQYRNEDCDSIVGSNKGQCHPSEHWLICAFTDGKEGLHHPKEEGRHQYDDGKKLARNKYDKPVDS